MFSDVEAHVVERIAGAPLITAPFPHCVIDGIFPQDFYEEILDQWPALDRFVSNVETGRVTRGYSDGRKVLNFDEAHLARLEPAQRAFWVDAVLPVLRSRRLLEVVLEKFRSQVEERWERAPASFETDAVIVSDRTDYALGPHSDSPEKLVSFLFYLPEDATFRRFGTSLYVPRDPAFTCREGRHYDERHFVRVATVEFVPNRVFLFPRSDRSFHGVAKVDLTGIERRLLLSSIRIRRSA